MILLSFLHIIVSMAIVSDTVVTQSAYATMATSLDFLAELVNNECETIGKRGICD